MPSSQPAKLSRASDILKVSDLSVSFGDVDVLQDVSFRVKEGEFAVVIGPNGAGKSVLIKTVLGLIPAKSGEVDLHVAHQDIGYVPQRLHFDPTFPLTVRELLLLKLPQATFWWGRKKSEQRVEQMLDLTKSSKVIDRPIGKLSGGELQRVLLAYALVNQPRLLILDEPAAGVDVVGEQTFYELIDLVRHTGVTESLHGRKKPQKHEHVTVIMISHDLDAVYKYADNVICINRKLLCSGIPNKVLTPSVLAKAYGHHKDVFHHDHQYQQNHEHLA